MRKSSSRLKKSIKPFLTACTPFNAFAAVLWLPLPGVPVPSESISITFLPTLKGFGKLVAALSKYIIMVSRGFLLQQSLYLSLICQDE